LRPSSSTFTNATASGSVPRFEFTHKLKFVLCCHGGNNGNGDVMNIPRKTSTVFLQPMENEYSRCTRAKGNRSFRSFSINIYTHSGAKMKEYFKLICCLVVTKNLAFYHFKAGYCTLLNCQCVVPDILRSHHLT